MMLEVLPCDTAWGFCHRMFARNSGGDTALWSASNPIQEGMRARDEQARLGDDLEAVAPALVA